MKIIFIVAVLFSWVQTVTCQNKKQIVYMNSNGVEISEKDYRALNSRETFIKETENDSLIFKTIFQRKNIIQLDSIGHNQFKMFLKKIIGEDFYDYKHTIIHLYRSSDKLYKDVSNKGYWEWIETNSNKYQSFFIGTKDSDINVEKNKHIYVDEYDYLKKLFFKNSDFSINHIFLKPNGEIYYYFGIENIVYVLDSCT
jgi:hypothetical protein